MSVKTIASQIEDLETEILRCESRLEAIDRKKRLTDMTDIERKELIQEKKELEKHVLNSRNALKGLRWENWKSMLVSVILLAVGYVVFMLVYTSSDSYVSGS